MHDTQPADGQLARAEIARQPLGQGLAHLTIAYRLCVTGSAPIEMGQAEGYALPIDASAEICIEIDTDPPAREMRRRVCIVFPSGAADQCNTARQLHQLATLLRHDSVYAALARWAAEDAEAEQAEQRALAEG